MDRRNSNTMANVVSWLAIIISIIALVLAWMAFNNASEENLGDMIQDQMQDTVQTEQPVQEDVNNNALDNTGVDGTTDPATEENVDGTTGTEEGDSATRPEEPQSPMQ